MNGWGNRDAGTQLYANPGSHTLTLNETLPASGITAIFGVSGAGKTSLINAISGLTRPQSGRIVLNNRVLNDAEKKVCLSPDKRRIGYVFQDARLFPHYSVRGNLRYGMAKSMAGQFDKLVALLGIEPLLIVCRRRCRVVKNSAWRLAAPC